MQFAFFKVTLPDALVLHRQEQALFVAELELFQQRYGNQRQRVDAGKRCAVAGDRGDPRREQLIVGQRGKQYTLILALRFRVPER